MNQYVFLLREETEHLSGNDCPTPDSFDLQGFPFGLGPNMDEALDQLIEYYLNPDSERIGLVLPIDIRNDQRRLSFWQENREKVTTAS